MKKKIMLAALVWLAGAIYIGTGCATETFCGGQAFAGKKATAAKSSKEMQQDIDSANAEKEKIIEEKKQLKKDIAQMEDKKSNVVDYIQELDEKLNGLSDKIDSNKTDIVKTKKEIKQLQKAKKKAEKTKEKQYDTMKRRIKYMYENGSEGYLELLLDSGSLAELFNRTEYIGKVSDFDRNMFHNYEKICQEIILSKKKVEAQLNNLNHLKENLTARKETVDLLVTEKNKELEKYNIEIDSKNTDMSNKNALLAAQQEELENLMAAQRKKAEEEEKARIAANKRKNQNTHSSQNNQNNQSNQNSQNQNNVSQNTTGGYGWPLATSGRITSYFGKRNAPTAGASSYHKGIDIAVSVGSSVLAVKAGTVVTATYSSTAGNYICLFHGDGVYSYYMHCSSLKVSQGQQVKKGARIALSGNTGVSTGPHLHFGLYMNGGYVNPLSYLNK